MKVTVKNCVIRKKSGRIEFDEKRAIKLIAGVLMFCQTEKQKIYILTHLKRVIINLIDGLECQIKKRGQI